MSSAEPVVWMNVTTSANWNRPPVGIVRVEQALCLELEQIFGPERFKRCIWRDGDFVEYTPAVRIESPDVADLLDALLPSTSSFELARQHLATALSRLETQGMINVTPEDERTIELRVPRLERNNGGPSAGDILISVGLDWDYPYVDEFFDLSVKRKLHLITCCHDFIPVLFPQYCVDEVAAKFKEYFLKMSWGAAAVLCISQQTRRDYFEVCAALGAPQRRTCLIRHGDNIPTEIGQLSDGIRALAETPFIIFVSTIEQRKNHEVLYKAYHILCRRGLAKQLPKLVFVGMPAWGVGDLLKDIELDPLTSGLIVQLHHVSDAELNALYRHALFCVYPSLYEGWGLPVGEALALGKAVIASSEGSLPEVGGDLVMYLDPWHAQAWADAIWGLVQDPSLIREMEQNCRENYRPQTWSDTAQSVKDLIDEMSAEGRQSESLLPGHDMSTAVGTHIGPAICSTGMAGFLLFGPHRALQAGRYLFQLSVSRQDDSPGALYSEVVSDGGQVIHGHLIKYFDRATGASQTVEIEASFETSVTDFEFRCRVDAGLMVRLEALQVLALN